MKKMGPYKEAESGIRPTDNLLKFSKNLGVSLMVDSTPSGHVSGLRIE